MALDRNQLPNDPEALKQLVLRQEAWLEALKAEVIRLRRWRFGRSAEVLDARVAPELALSGGTMPTATLPPEPTVPPNDALRVPKLLSVDAPLPRGGTRRPPRVLPPELVRVICEHRPTHCHCSECGGPLSRLGEDVSEQLDYVPGYFQVIRHVRPKLACRSCASIVQMPAPMRPIERGLPTAGLLAQVIGAKYADHCPLYRQEGIYRRSGVQLPRATLASWVAEAARLLDPLVSALEREVMASNKLHADDTPVPVLSPGKGRTKTGRLWAYVRDDRPAAGPDPPAVVYRYSPDRKAERPQAHLSHFIGVLQADGYAGFNGLYERPEHPLLEAACWAHARRKYSHDRPSSTGAQRSVSTALRHTVVDPFCETRVRTPRVSRRSLLLSFGDWCPIVISSRRAASIYDRRSERVGSINLPEDSLNRSRRPGSCLTDSCFRCLYLCRRGFAVCSGFRARSAQESQFLRDRPDEAKQFACDRGHRDLAFFAARHELAIAPAQANLCLPRNRFQTLRSCRHSAQHSATDLLPASIRPRGLDQETADHLIARLRDASSAHASPARVFAGHQAEICHQLPRIGKALQISNLGYDADRDRFRDAA